MTKSVYGEGVCNLDRKERTIAAIEFNLSLMAPHALFIDAFCIHTSMI